MLVLGSRLLNTPVMSLHTGARLAQLRWPVIDPANLKIIAYELEGPLLTETPSYLRTADIREYAHLGMIVDSNDEFVGLEDVVKIKQLVELGFPLVGMHVIDEFKRKLGKVEDYTLDTKSFFVQQLHVRRGLLRGGITDTGLLIHRTQIVEINNTNIVVRTTARQLKPIEEVKFLNPFRQRPNTETQPEHMGR